MQGPTPPVPLPTDQSQFAMPPMYSFPSDDGSHVIAKERLAGRCGSSGGSASRTGSPVSSPRATRSTATASG